MTSIARLKPVGPCDPPTHFAHSLRHVAGNLSGMVLAIHHASSFIGRMYANGWKPDVVGLESRDARPRPCNLNRLVPPERVLRIAALRREVEAVPLGGITRVVETKLRHKVAEGLDLPPRIICRAAERA